MNWFLDLYRNNSGFRTAVQVIEGGAIMGFVTASANGIDLSKKGVTALGASILGGVIVAVRNYFTNRIGQPAVPKQ